MLLLLFAKGSCTAPKVNAGGTIPPHDGSDSLHLAFSVESTELQDWENLLTANGVAVESQVTWPRGGASLYFRDPDGHLVELVSGVLEGG